MHLPVNPPVLPMLARRIDALPEGDGWFFEPKWDGFRAIIFRDGDEIAIESRDARPLNRYCPELVAALREGLPERCVLDGEIVIVTPHGLDFDLLQMRLHPAASRVDKLAKETPASIVFFDLIADGKRDWRDAPFAERRAALAALLGKPKPPTTRDRRRAEDWFARFEGAGFDGVMAKHETVTYQSNKRVMFKVKHEREADCVVAGFRWHKNGQGTEVGSLLLGLYDDGGDLQHVGVCASFTAEKRRALVAFLEPYRMKDLAGHPWADWASAEGEDATHRRPGAESRWSQGKDLSWVALRPELVVEVAYDHMQGGRFRHTAQFRRWREDKAPKDCTFEQLEVVAPAELRKVFGTGVRDQVSR
jgi:ATP-dependent DNA ligase